MNNYKLIKITEGYVIVSDKEINFMDTMKSCYYLFENKVYKRDSSHHKIHQKIIASNFIPELYNIDFNGLEEKFGIVDIKNLAFDKYPEIIKERWYKEGLAYEEDIHEDCREGFIEGFNKCLELNKDKLYTEDELIKNFKPAFDKFINDGGAIGSNEDWIQFQNIVEWFPKYIQSLQPKTEWDIDIETYSCPEKPGVCALGCVGKCNPKIENNSIKIIKILK